MQRYMQFNLNQTTFILVCDWFSVDVSEIINILTQFTSVYMHTQTLDYNIKSTFLRLKIFFQIYFQRKISGHHYLPS